MAQGTLADEEGTTGSCGTEGNEGTMAQGTLADEEGTLARGTMAREVEEGTTGSCSTEGDESTMAQGTLATEAEAGTTGS